MGTAKELDRRSFVKAAMAAGISGSTLAILAGCGAQGQDKKAPEKATEQKAEKSAGNEIKSEVAAPLTVAVGDTLANLKSALQGETNASAKYREYAKIAKQEGYDQISRLFECTADAEQTHIELEFEAAKELDPKIEKPKADTASSHGTNLDLIAGANGEIYETSLMYPAFIEVAKKENKTKALHAFEQAKAAEGYHAELYMDLYNTIDKLDGSAYYRCPICGYIRKGETDTSACPICATKPSEFIKY